MTAYAKIAAAFLGIIEWVAKIMHDKQLMDAGRAKAESEFTGEALRRIKRANGSAVSARNADGVPDDFYRD